MQILRSGGEPMWERIRRLMFDEIRSGHYRPGDQLPTEKEYAERWDVSLAPVRAALAHLANAGYIERQSGKGTFVSTKNVSYEISLLRSATNSLREAGAPFVVNVLDQRMTAVPAEIAAQLGVDQQATVFHLRRMIEIAGQVAVILESWIPADLADGLEDDPRFAEGGSLYTLFTDRGIALTTAEGWLEVIRADDDHVDLMNVDFGTPLLQLDSIASAADGRVVEASRAVYDVNRFLISVNKPLLLADPDPREPASPRQAPEPPQERHQRTMTELETLTREVNDNKVPGGSLFGRTIARIIELTLQPLSDRTPSEVLEALHEAGAWANRTKPSMTSVRNVVDLALQTGADAAERADATGASVVSAVSTAMSEFIERSEAAIVALADNIAAVIPEGARVMYHSNSGSLRSVMRRIVDTIPGVTINLTESRPYRESRGLIEGISETDVPVTLYSDAASALAVSKSDIVLVGADAVLADGTLVNKTGTLPIALACKYFNVPIYGVTELSKVFRGPSDEVEMEVRPSHELAAGWGLIESGRVDVWNQFFEPTPPQLITGYITEVGLVEPARIADAQ